MIELVGDELYQWDVGRKVKITPKRGYTISCVHFNDGSDDSLTMVNGIATARIPDELLQQCGSVTVYAVSTKEGGIETTESRQFYIKKKTKPTGYTHVPTEVATINSAITAATQAKASANEAKGYSDSAKTYASNASTSATNASTSENNAKTYASNASTSATNASTSANNANTYKTAAEQARDEAKGYSDSAKTYASNASTSATNASTSENNAQTYKEEAENARNAIKSIESDMSTAVEAAGQIDSFRSEITTYRNETKKARDDILSKGDDNKSVYEKIIDAETSIIGSGGTVADPKEGSALRATKDAQKAAAQSAKEAKEAAASANQGIVVVDSLKDTSTANALSANKGKELNESKLNLSGGTMTGTLKLNGDPSNSNDAATKNYVDTQIAKKVDKVDGKGLSTNDYTNADKVKLDGLENALAAKVNKEDGKGLSTNDYTTNEKTKLAGLENYTLPTASDTVKGGIKVGAGLTMNGEVLSATGGGTADAVDWSNVTNKPETFAPSTHTHTASEVTELATVATSGSYNDLSDKPTDFAPAAHTHEMTDIIGLSDALDGKSDTTHNHDGTYLKEVPKATKDTLGGIKVGNNLSITEDGKLSANAQKIDVDDTLNSNSVNPVQNKIVKNALDGKSDTTHNHDGTYLKPVDVSTSITENSTSAVSSGAVYTQLSGLKFVVSKTAPTSADDKTFTIVVPN